MITDPAMPQVKRPVQARNPQLMTAKMAIIEAIGPVRMPMRVCRTDCTGCSPVSQPLPCPGGNAAADSRRPGGNPCGGG